MTPTSPNSALYPSGQDRRPKTPDPSPSHYPVLTSPTSSPKTNCISARLDTRLSAREATWLESMSGQRRARHPPAPPRGSKKPRGKPPATQSPSPQSARVGGGVFPPPAPLFSKNKKAPS